MKIILVSHGNYAEALMETAKMIVGPFDDVHAFGIHPGEDLNKFQDEIIAVIKDAESKNQDIFAFSDIFFGTPFNTVTRLMQDHNIQHFAGINMPLLLEVLTSKDTMNKKELTDYIKEASKKVFVDVNDYLKNDD